MTSLFSCKPNFKKVSTKRNILMIFFLVALSGVPVLFSQGRVHPAQAFVSSELTSVLSSPAQDSILLGQVLVKGTAKHGTGDKFSSYILEYQKTHLANGSKIANPVWTKIASSNFMVDDGTLANWNTSALGGTFKIRLSVFDKSGNVAEDMRSIKIDNIKPTIKIQSPAGKLISESNRAILAIIADDASQLLEPFVFVNNQLVECSSASGYLIIPVAGNYDEYKIEIMVVDDAGNKAVHKSTFFGEWEGPAVVIDNPNDGAVAPYGTPITVQGLVWSWELDNWVLKYKRAESSNYQTASYSTKVSIWPNINLASLPALPSGSYDILVSAKNKQGGTRSEQVRFEISSGMSVTPKALISDVRYMESIPSRWGYPFNFNQMLKVGGVANHPNFGSYKIFLSQIEPITGPQVQIYSSKTPVEKLNMPWEPSILAYAKINANGKYRLSLKMYNASGVEIGSHIYGGILELDTTPPRIVSTFPVNGAFTNMSKPISIKATDPEPSKLGPTSSGLYNVDLFIDDRISREASLRWYSEADFDVPELEDGEHTLEFVIHDFGWNIAERKINFTKDTIPPVAEVNHGIEQPTVIKGSYIVKGKAYDKNLLNYGLQYKQVNGYWKTAFTSKLNVPVTATLGTWNTSALAGEYLVRLEVVDKAGNKSYYPALAHNDDSKALRYLIDNKAPTLGAISPADKSYQKIVSSVILSGAHDLNALKTTAGTTGIATSSISVTLNGQTITHMYNQASGIITASINEALPNGSHQVKISVPDNAGNVATAVSNFVFDTINPVAQLSIARESIKSGNKLTIGGKATDANIATWTLSQKLSSATTYTKIASGTSNAGSPDYPVTLGVWSAPVVQGTYNLKLDVVDKAGNSSIATANIVVDAASNYSDAAQITYPSTGNILRGKVPVNGTASSTDFAYYTISRKLSTSTIETQVAKGTAPVEGGTLTNFNTAGLNGTFNLILRRYKTPAAPVLYGSPVTLTGLIIDNLAPIVSSVIIPGTGAQAGFTRTSNPTLEINTKELGSGLEKELTELSINSQKLGLVFGENASYDPVSGKMLVTLPSLVDGKYALSVRLHDKAGNTGKTFSYLLTVDTDETGVPTLPTAKITDPPTSSYHKGAANIIGTAFDPNVFSYTLSAKVTGTSSYTPFYTGKANARDATLGSFRSSLNGEFDIKLSLKDKAGNPERLATTKVIMDNIAPVATITKIGGLAIGSVTQVTGTVDLSGAAYDRGGLNDLAYPNDSFDRYVIDIGYGAAPIYWTTLTESNTPIGNETTQSTLHSWNTSAHEPGTWTLRIRTFEKTGTIKELRKTLKII